MSWTSVGSARRVDPLEVPVDQRAQRQQQLAQRRGQPLLEVGGIRSRSDCSTPASSSSSALRRSASVGPRELPARRGWLAGFTVPRRGLAIAAVPGLRLSGSTRRADGRVAGIPIRRSGPTGSGPRRSSRSGGLRDQPLGCVRGPVEPLLEPAQRVVLGAPGLAHAFGLGGSLGVIESHLERAVLERRRGRMQRGRARGAA